MCLCAQFGHMERPAAWAQHLVLLRQLQARTGGITEFVPLPFVHMEAPIYLRGAARLPEAKCTPLPHRENDCTRVCTNCSFIRGVLQMTRSALLLSGRLIAENACITWSPDPAWRAVFCKPQRQRLRPYPHDRSCKAGPYAAGVRADACGGAPGDAQHPQHPGAWPKPQHALCVRAPFHAVLRYADL